MAGVQFLPKADSDIYVGSSLKLPQIFLFTWVAQNFLISSNFGILPLLKVYSNSVSQALSVDFRESKIGWAN